MRKLSRKGVVEPNTWADDVAKAVPDLAYFKRRAKSFERQKLETRRDAGFKAYAADALPMVGGNRDWKNIWRKALIPLAEMSEDKCAYCETPITDPGEEHVDHFKPKSIFPTAAFCWDNYFVACPPCNRHKKSNWPDKGGYLRPDQGSPHSKFRFLENGKIESVPKTGRVPQMIEDFKLDRRLLRKARRMVIETMLEDLDNLLEGLDQEEAKKKARRFIRGLMPLSRAYSVALFQCAEAAWKKRFPKAKLGVTL